MLKMTTVATLPKRAPTAPPASRHMNKFQIGDRLVYPSQGISWLNAIRTVSVDDVSIPSLILTAEDRGSSLAVPVAQAERGVLRPLASKATLSKAMAVLGEPRRQRRAVWAQHAKDYEAKIKTGDPLLLSEVLRDLHRNGEQSYSEKQIFTRALARLVAEAAAVLEIEQLVAQDRIIERLAGRATQAAGP